MPYDINGKAVDRNEKRHDASFYLFLLIPLIIVIAFASVCIYKETTQPTTPITIDTTDEELMHELGLPTKTDVEMWHDVHRWGYSTENVMHTEHVYTELPGRNPDAWDRLYGIGE